ncbi:MAG: sodium:proton antiporter [Bacteroidetes bacterium]|jgi:NhaP-type Na+/H+ or K+/H+ antiporter|nr:sodium:proton antiporter [Bacteroidota bacterium]
MLELSSIVILGIFAQWVAWKSKLPAILPLILIGLIVGPFSTFLTIDGSKWIEPIWNGTHGLFPSNQLFSFVSLAIGIILFEGSMTLKKSEIKSVGPVIFKLITLGSLVTLIGGALAVHYLIGLNWAMSFLFSSLIIVTGPTVINPILRNLPLKKEISTVLKWESILIDPIGALVAVLIFEFINVGQGSGESYTTQAVIDFSKIVVTGFSLGFTAAHALYFAIKRNWIPHYLMNLITLATVLLIFVISDLFAHESGLLTVVVMGMVIGNKNVTELKDIIYFKETISILLISMLFILLAANINIRELKLLLNNNILILFLIIILIIRPIGVFLSSRNSSLNSKEKFFISWVGPRGIVAAGIASLFGLKLALAGKEGAEYITPLVFMVVLGTVLLNATTARLVAKGLGVYLKHSTGVLIIGASEVSRLIALYLQEQGRRVVLIDSNPILVDKAKELSLEAFEDNIYSDDLLENIELNDIGYLLALSGSNEVNKFAMSKFSEQFGESGSFRLISPHELKNPKSVADEILFSVTDDFINLSEVARDYPVINELHLKSTEHYESVLASINAAKYSIPLFVKDNYGIIHIITTFKSVSKVQKGYKFIYLGKELEGLEV